MGDWAIIFALALALAVAIPVVMYATPKWRGSLAMETFGADVWWKWPLGILSYYMICCVAVALVLAFLGVFGPIPLTEAYRR